LLHCALNNTSRVNTVGYYYKEQITFKRMQ
jgi:hypothetical protein